MIIAFCVIKKSFPIPKPWKYSLLCPSKVFIDFDFTFMSMIHFKLTFVSTMK